MAALDEPYPPAMARRPAKVQAPDRAEQVGRCAGDCARAGRERRTGAAAGNPTVTLGPEQLQV